MPSGQADLSNVNGDPYGGGFHCLHVVRPSILTCCRCGGALTLEKFLDTGEIMCRDPSLRGQH